jgi:hypothetical protein
VEVARDGEWVGVRDGKDGPASPVLIFSVTEWETFVNAAKAGQFDTNRI